MSAPIPMRCPSFCGGALCLVIGGAAQGDVLDRARIASIAGSERLRTFAYGKLLETGDAPQDVVTLMRQTLTSQGFYYEFGQSRVIATEAWLEPVLSYDGNINGGVLQDSFSYGGFIFEADPNFRAKGGVVMGLSGGGVARLAWANGRYVEGRLRAEAVWSPEHQIGRSNSEFALCSRNHVQGWSFVDVCQTVSAVKRELGTSESQETALAVTQLFQTEAAYHEVTAELSETHYDIGDQPTITLSWASIWDKAATKFSLGTAAPIEGETALRMRVAADVQWLWEGHATGLGLWYQKADGGAFLGTPHADKAMGISLSYQFRPGLSAQISYMTNQSSVDFFDYAQTSVNVGFEALRW
ncbi:hypothetical protein [Cypionkella sp.]|uniref:hypothetical protein n=1 Tax=Cypionkella sp. TaxID=2811411 RepID=UPI00260D68A2|nr:hypothetical protein [Cypionkella sp.]